MKNPKNPTKQKFKIVVLDGDEEGKVFYETSETVTGAKEALQKKIKFKHCYMQSVAVVEGDK